MLGNNSISGSIPDEWSALELLDVVDFSGNSWLNGPVPMSSGVYVNVQGTGLAWDGDNSDVWARHKNRWEMAQSATGGDRPEVDDLDLGKENLQWTEPGQCSFCANLPEDQDRCTCVRDCCQGLGDRSLCIQYVYLCHTTLTLF